MTRPRSDAPAPQRPAISDATVDVLLCTQALIEERLALSAARAGTAVQHALVPTGLAFVALATGLAAGAFATAALTLGLALWVPWWAATGIVSGVLTLLSITLCGLAVWTVRSDHRNAHQLDDPSTDAGVATPTDAVEVHTREAA